MTYYAIYALYLDNKSLSLGESSLVATLKYLFFYFSEDSNIKYRQDDFYLLRFLRVRKYDVQKAYYHVKHFFEVRRKHSDYFVLPRELKSGLELKFITFLPYTDEEGAILFRLSLGETFRLFNNLNNLLLFQLFTFQKFHLCSEKTLM